MEFTGYWMFNCNPDRWNHEKFFNEFKAGNIEDGDFFWGILHWQSKHFVPGQYGILRVGKGKKNFPSGVYAIVRVESEPYLRLNSDRFWFHLEDANKVTLEEKVELSVVAIIEPCLSIETCQNDGILNQDTNLTKGRQARCWPLSAAAFERIASLVGVSDKILYHPMEIDSLAEEISEDGEPLPEGAQKNIAVNAYERNPKARAKCIAHWGTRCSVCDFDFEQFYGSRGAGYIHVHHLKPLNQIGKTYIVDPVKDLRPICPNCHSMLHLDRKHVLSIEELKEMIKPIC